MLAVSRAPARTLTLAAAAAAALAGLTAGSARAAETPTRLPVYDVRAAGSVAEQGDRLARAFELDARLLGEDGSLSFLDADRFGFLPTRPVDAPGPDEEGREVIAEAPDLDAIRKLQPISAAEARKRALRALPEAGVDVAGRGKVSHSQFESFDANGEQDAKVAVDTHVSFPTRLGGQALIGPGAKAKFVFDGDGRLTYLRYAKRDLEEGKTLPLLPTEEADRLAVERFTAGCADQGRLTGLKLSRKLVYYAPSLSLGSVQQIVPHYDYGAVASIGGERVKLERVLMPAVAEGVAPQAALTAQADGGRVSASTTVEGGTAPYTYHYSSCATTLPDRAALGGPDTAYKLSAREGSRGPIAEKLSVVVTDANGLTTTASTTLDVNARVARAARRSAPLARASVGGTIDVATEWIGNSQGLPNSAANTWDFRDEMSDVSSIAFNWGDNDVFESDFVDPSLGGDDSNWADNVDLMWFQGHGNSNGFATGNRQGDEFVHRNDARWGNNDLEWLVVHSCDVLALGSGATHVWNRWSPAFRGLHLLMGYGNSSYNVDGDGNEFGDDLADDDMRIRSAWVDANEDEQPSGVIYRYMGVYGPNGEWNRDDYFHGIGSVSGDITSPNGAWSYSGTV